MKGEEKKTKTLELDKDVVDTLGEVKKYMKTKDMKVDESEIIMAALKIVKRTAGYWTLVCEMGGAKR
jgi:hypothetical protein